MKCAVINCPSKQGDCSFHSFPSNAKIKKKWMDFCGRGKKAITKSSYICMYHFEVDDFENNTQFDMGFAKQRLLRHGAIPSINTALVGNVKLNEERTKRVERRDNKKIVASLLKDQNKVAKPLDTTRDDEIQNLQEFEVVYDVPKILVDTYEMENLPEGCELVCNPSESRDDNIVDVNNSEVEDDEIKNLRMEIQTLRNTNKALTKQNRKYCSELKAMEDKMQRAGKIHDYNVNKLEKKLTKALYQLKNLEKKLQNNFHQRPNSETLNIRQT